MVMVGWGVVVVVQDFALQKQKFQPRLSKNRCVWSYSLHAKFCLRSSAVAKREKRRRRDFALKSRKRKTLEMMGRLSRTKVVAGESC